MGKLKMNYMDGLKRIITLTSLLAIFLIATFTLNTYADTPLGDFKYSIESDGTYTITGFSGSDTNIIIPSEISGKSVTSISSEAFSGCSRLTSISIPNSVTSIGWSAFSKCSGLTSISIPNSVTSISYRAFYGCSGLTSISIPNSVTSIGSGAFSGCNKLTKISVDSNNKVYDSRNNCNAIIERNTNKLVAGCKNTIIPDGVTSFSESAFNGCSGLTSISIPNSVTSISDYAFYGCTGLTSISIPNSVTSISNYAFYGCTGLTSISIPNSVTSIGWVAFNGCSKLTKISVDSNNKIYDSRNNCNAIIERNTNKLVAGCKNTIIPDSVTSIGGGAFFGCSGLTSISIPNSVTSIGWGAFGDCNKLTSISIPSSVTSIGQDAFSLETYNQEKYYYTHNDNITFKVTKNSIAEIWLKLEGFTKIIYISGDNPGAVLNSENFQYKVIKQGSETASKIVAPEVIFVKPQNKKLTMIKIPATITVNYVVYKVTSIDANAFKNNKKLKSVVIGSNIKSIGKNAFSGCKKLKKVTLKTKKLTKIGKKAFKATHKNITFKCPKKKLKKYKKMLKKAGASKKAKYMS